MFEPVWLGNYIVPRWEAIAVVLGVPAVGLFVMIIACALVYSGIVRVIKWMMPRGK
jgi:hypothetical protein